MKRRPPRSGKESWPWQLSPHPTTMPSSKEDDGVAIPARDALRLPATPVWEIALPKAIVPARDNVTVVQHEEEVHNADGDANDAAAGPVISSPGEYSSL